MVWGGWGAKGLKGISVLGGGGVAVADPRALCEARLGYKSES